MSLNLSSHQGVQKLLFDVVRFDMQYSRFIEDTARRIIHQEILLPIKSEMKRFDYSQKIIDSTRIGNFVVTDDGFLQFDVISDYKSETGFDVAAAREKGTKRHFIKPITKLALSWIVGGFVKAFSKGHWVKGITKSNVIKKTIETRFPIAQGKIEEASITFFNNTVSS